MCKGEELALGVIFSLQGKQQFPLASAKDIYASTSYTQRRYFLMKALNGILNM